MTINKIDLVKIILKTVAVGGVISIAILAPNALQALAKMGLLKRHHNYYIPTAIQKLKTRGLLMTVEKNGKKYIRLTDKGIKLLAKYERDDVAIKRPAKWDGKYRVVIFDIKEYKRSVRNEIRHWLIHLGFVRLQNSVWVHPFECREVVALLKADQHVGREVVYMTVEEIENDGWIRKAFDLESSK